MHAIWWQMHVAEKKNSKRQPNSIGASTHWKAIEGRRKKKKKRASKQAMSIQKRLLWVTVVIDGSAPEGVWRVQGARARVATDTQDSELRECGTLLSRLAAIARVNVCGGSHRRKLLPSVVLSPAHTKGRTRVTRWTDGRCNLFTRALWGPGAQWVAKCKLDSYPLTKYKFVILQIRPRPCGWCVVTRMYYS